MATFIVECYWPGLTREAVAAADERARRLVAEIGASDSSFGYVGSVLMPGDEVVFFEFEARSRERVAEAAADAGLPFARVVESVHLGPVPH